LKEHWKIEEKNYGTMLTLLDEWDLDRVNEFSNYINKNLVPEKNQNFIVNLEKVDFIDSMALGVLINLNRRYKEEGGTVYLMNPRKTVENILKQSGIYKIFQIFHSEKELIKHIESQSLQGAPPKKKSEDN
jgi:anti-anti-sigma factor